MPHTTKKEYQKQHQEVPNCTPNTEVFFLHQTNEVFTDYDEYFERILQLFSSVWICSITGRSGFTYEEALESEKEALELVNSFPKCLRLPVLFLVYKFSQRARIDDLVNDVLYFMKDRFFLGELVLYKNGSKTNKAKITGIDYNDDGQNQINNGENDNPILPNPSCFQYTLRVSSNETEINSDESEGEDEEDDSFAETKNNLNSNISHKKIRRGKTVATKPRLKLFIKYNTEVKVDHLVVKNEVVNQYKLDKLNWEDVFAGPIPNFPKTKRQKKSDANTKKDAKLENNESDSLEKTTPTTTLDHPSSTVKKQVEREPSESAIKKREIKAKAKIKKEIEEQQQELSQLFQAADKHNVENMERWRQNERLLFSEDVQELREAIVAAKEMERAKVLEKRRREKEELAEWKKPRDDLLCDDLKPLPKFQEFIWPDWIPSELYMKILSMYNFLVGFYEIFPKHQQFTLWEVALALVTKRRDAHSQYFRLIRYLLETVGACIDEDEGDEADLDKPEEIGNEQNKDIDHPVHGAKIRAINVEHALIRDAHGFSVRHLKIDPLTITEVVRLSLLTSGYYTATRRTNRGGMRCFEDDGYLFAQNNVEIMNILEKESIYDLDPIQRFELANVFVNQLMSHILFRNLIEKRTEKLVDLRRALRQLQQINYQYEREAKSALQSKNSESAEQQQNPATKRPSKELLTLRRFLQTFNEGLRITNISEIKQLFLEGELPWAEMEPNEIAEFRLVQNDFFAQEMKLVQEEIFNLNALMGNCFLGRDRAFRSFYFLHYFSVFVIEPPNFDGTVECSEATTPISQANMSSLLESIKEPSENNRQNLLIALNACTGDMNCPVHRKNNTYYFYAEENGIEKLLNSLNPRGYREIELADNINLLKNVYAQSMDRVARKYSPDGISIKAFGLHNPMKDVALADSSQVEFLKFVTEKILELEQNIHEKQLGILQITVERDQWRTLLKETGDTSTVCFDNIVYLQNSLSDEILYTSDDLDPTMHKLNQIQKLGIALLQVFQGTRLECLEDPFVGEDEQNREIILPTSTYVIWQKELVKCQSPSALALFVQTFSRVVNWNFVSPLNRCPACKRKVFESTKPVFCIQCGEAYHSRCVRTPSNLSNWHCPTCFAEIKRMEHETVKNEETNSLNSEQGGRKEKADSGKRMLKKRVEYSPTPSSSSSNNNRSTERSSMEENEQYNGTKSMFVIDRVPLLSGARKRRPVRKYGEFVYNEDMDPGTDSADSLYEFFGRRSNVEKEVKRRKKEDEEGHIRSISMGLRESGMNRSRKELIKLWENAICDARKQPFAEPFVELVDKRYLPQYYEVIKEPMALQTIIQKIKAYEYDATSDVWADCELIFRNCETFNEAGSPIIQQCHQLREFMKAKFDAI